MRILYVALKYDYGNPSQGYSFEHCNFYDSLVNMGHDVLYFDFLSLMQERGKEWMNRRLVDMAKTEKPDLMFTVLFQDQLDPNAIREISENTETVTLNWFCDDHWRFDNFSRYWAPCFNWVTTTAESALPKYEALGYSNVVKTQWACNHFSYRDLGLALKHDVTFVGMPHGNRPQVLEQIYRAGIDIKVWGSGWQSGRLSQEEMIRTFNESKINLNLSNSSTPAVSSAEPGGGLSHNQLKLSDQIKGRNFEVPGCGGFVLTGQAENLEAYFDLGKEVVCYKNVEELIEKIRHFLSNEDERATIAQAGHSRTLQEHTYTHRFTDIFAQMGLPTTDATLESGSRR